MKDKSSIQPYHIVFFVLIFSFGALIAFCMTREMKPVPPPPAITKERQRIIHQNAKDLVAGYGGGVDSHAVTMTINNGVVTCVTTGSIWKDEHERDLGHSLKEYLESEFPHRYVKVVVNDEDF